MARKTTNSELRIGVRAANRSGEIAYFKAEGKENSLGETEAEIAGGRVVAEVENDRLAAHMEHMEESISGDAETWSTLITRENSKNGGITREAGYSKIAMK